MSTKQYLAIICVYDYVCVHTYIYNIIEYIYIHIRNIYGSPQIKWMRLEYRIEQMISESFSDGFDGVIGFRLSSLGKRDASNVEFGADPDLVEVLGEVSVIYNKLYTIYI